MIRLILLSASLAVSACTPAPPPLASALLTSAADPARKIPPLRVGNAASGTRSFALVEPHNWEDINRDNAPALKGATP
jgi:hypothetical protein